MPRAIGCLAGCPWRTTETTTVTVARYQCSSGFAVGEVPQQVIVNIRLQLLDPHQASWSMDKEASERVQAIKEAKRPVEKQRRSSLVDNRDLPADGSKVHPEWRSRRFIWVDEQAARMLRNTWCCTASDRLAMAGRTLIPFPRLQDGLMVQSLQQGGVSETDRFPVVQLWVA